MQEHCFRAHRINTDMGVDQNLDALLEVPITINKGVYIGAPPKGKLPYSTCSVLRLISA